MTPPPAETSLLGLPFAGVPAVSPVFGAAAPFRPAATWRRALVFAGPGCLIAVGYMDPGNWATDLAAGSRFGYALLPAILVSSLVAMFLQHLSLKLGVATGRDLAQHCRAALRPRTALALWLAAEVGIVACDLAEVLGTAVALKLLFGLPLLAGVAATALDSLILLGLLRVGCRRLEAFVLALILVVGACFAAQLALARPGLRDIAPSLAPTPALVTDPAKLYLALGVFGATVMPHNLYLHSALAGSRAARASPAARREAVRFSSLDSGAALTLALLVNAAILILAAAAFHARGHPEVAGLEDAHRLLSPLLGTSAAGLLFALALLASGQNSTLTGTLAGQVVMEGMTGLRLDPRLRRLVTRGLAIAPALVVIGLAGEGSVTPLLIGSQVVLSLQLGFAVIPLVSFTSDRGVMGDLANGKAVRRIGWAIGSAIVAVNGWLVFQTMLGGL